VVGEAEGEVVGGAVVVGATVGAVVVGATVGAVVVGATVGAVVVATTVGGVVVGEVVGDVVAGAGDFDGLPGDLVGLPLVVTVGLRLRLRLAVGLELVCVIIDRIRVRLVVPRLEGNVTTLPVGEPCSARTPSAECAPAFAILTSTST
jgi:hypothetical protein